MINLACNFLVTTWNVTACHEIDLPRHKGIWHRSRSESLTFSACKMLELDLAVLKWINL